MYTIKTVESEAELEAVLRLRYRVFTEEMGRVSLADVHSRTYGDDMDRLGQPIFCGYDSAENLVSTLRLTPRADVPFWNESEYELHRLHEVHDLNLPVPLSCIGRVDRAVVIDSHRQTMLFHHMMNHLVAHARSIGLTTLVAVVDSTNSHFCRAVSEHGWKFYRHQVPFRDLLGHFISLDLSHGHAG